MKNWINKWQNVLWGKGAAWGAKKNNQLCPLILVKSLETKWTRNKRDNIWSNHQAPVWDRTEKSTTIVTSSRKKLESITNYDQCECNFCASQTRRTRSGCRSFEKRRGGGEGVSVKISDKGGPTMTGGNVPENFENQIPSRLHSVALNYVLLQKFLNILMK